MARAAFLAGILLNPLPVDPHSLSPSTGADVDFTGNRLGDIQGNPNWEDSAMDRITVHQFALDKQNKALQRGREKLGPSLGIIQPSDPSARIPSQAPPFPEMNEASEAEARRRAYKLYKQIHARISY